MSSYTEFTEKVTTRLVDAVKPVEEYASTVAGAVERVVATLPSLPVPSASEVLAANVAAADRLLTAQRALALRLVPAPRDAEGA